MNLEYDMERCNGLKMDEVMIMAQARIHLHGELASAVEIRRGMTVTCDSAREAGKVAGVAVSRDSRRAVCLILSRLPEEEGYQSIPVGWIKRVEGQVIVLNVRFEMIRALPDWHST